MIGYGPNSSDDYADARAKNSIAPATREKSRLPSRASSACRRGDQAGKPDQRLKVVCIALAEGFARLDVIQAHFRVMDTRRPR